MLDAIRDLDTQAAYLRDLCDYVNNYLADLQKVEPPGALTEHQQGVIYAATNRRGRDVRSQLEGARMDVQAWANEVRDAVNGYA